MPDRWAAGRLRGILRLIHHVTLADKGSWLYLLQPGPGGRRGSGQAVSHLSAPVFTSVKWDPEGGEAALSPERKKDQPGAEYHLI